MPANRYAHIASRIRDRIGDGTLATGARLPAETDLMAEFAASRPTVRQALEVLENEGLIVRRHGSGTYVRPVSDRIVYSNDRLAADKRNADATVKVVVTRSEVRADNRLSALLGVRPDSRLTEYVYRSFHVTAPYSLARIYVPFGVLTETAPDLDPSPLGDDIREQLSRAGVRVAATMSRISARLPQPHEADDLRIGNSTAVLNIERVSIDSNGQVVEAALLVLPGYNAEAVFTTHSLVHELETTR